MENSELDLIARLAPEHDELRHLYQRHQGFEREIAHLESLRNPSETERTRMNALKRQKLQGKDRIRKILLAVAR
jgi:uncharacterized protein YdcH (DUF465 family)